MRLIQVAKPIVGALVVVTVITSLHDVVSDAGVRSALGWGTASAVTELIAASWSWWSARSAMRAKTKVHETEQAKMHPRTTDLSFAPAPHPGRAKRISSSGAL